MITAAFRNRLFSHNLNMQQEQRYDLVEYGEGGFPIILFHLAWYTTDEQVVFFQASLQFSSILILLALLRFCQRIGII